MSVEQLIHPVRFRRGLLKRRMGVYYLISLKGSLIERVKKGNEWVAKGEKVKKTFREKPV